jgi:putative peptidoglycan lipid II flippase
MILNIILNIILSEFMGIGGLALATSISALFTTGLLFISLRNKIGSFGIRNISISFIKILCASLVMGAIARLLFNSLLSIISQNLALIISIGIGIIVYFAIIYFMKIDDIDIIASNVRKRLRIRRRTVET